MGGRLSTFLIVVGALFLSACGSGTTVDSASEPTAATAEEIDAVAPYFEGIHDDRALQRAREVVDPGSPADRYLDFLEVAWEATDLRWPEADDDIGSFDIWRPERTDEGHRACSQDDGECAEYTDLRVRDGRLVTYSVDGVALDERITVPDPAEATWTDDQAALEVAAVFWTVDGAVRVAYRLEGELQPAESPSMVLFRPEAGVPEETVQCEPNACRVNHHGGVSGGAGVYVTRVEEVESAGSRPGSRLGLMLSGRGQDTVVWIDLGTGAIVED